MSEQLDKRLSRTVTPDRILEQLRIDIITQRYHSGDRIAEADIASAFSASRGSVRSALQALESEGLIRVLPNGRREVVGFNRKLAHEMYELRWMMENRAVEIAQQEQTMLYAPLLKVLEQVNACRSAPSEETDWYQLDIEFHRALVKTANNVPLLKAWEINSPVMYALMKLNTSSDYLQNYISEFYDKHWTLFQAIITHDPECFNLLHTHIADAESISTRMLCE